MLKNTNEKTKERIAGIISEYDQQGLHRTGTDADTRTANWLIDRFRIMGFDADLETFQLDRIDVKKACLVVGDKRVDGVPLFDCAEYTGEAGVTGRLGKLGDPKAEIGVWLTPPVEHLKEARALEAGRAKAGHKAIVSITLTYNEGLFLLNAKDFKKPMGPPVLQISSVDCAWLSSELESAAEATVICYVEKVNTRSGNVGVRMKGKKPELPPLVVMTPRSGWWQCASERGGGIAAMLEIARSFSLRKPERDVIITANSGHELGHLGMDAFLTRQPGLINQAHAWIHLGANFAARDDTFRLAVSDEPIRAQALACFEHFGLPPDEVIPVGREPFGEAKEVFRKGGRYVSIGGDSSLFHSPEDRWPQAVDLEKTTAAVQALCRLVDQLAGT